MAIYKCSRGVEPGTTWLKSSLWLERDLNAGSPDFKSSDLTTRPRRLHKSKTERNIPAKIEMIGSEQPQIKASYILHPKDSDRCGKYALCTNGVCNFCFALENCNDFFSCFVCEAWQLVFAVFANEIHETAGVHCHCFHFRLFNL